MKSVSDITSPPALLGGIPIRPEGPPDWPPTDPAIARAFEQLARGGDWGRYAGSDTAELKERLQELHQVSAAILTCSGTSAVELALRGVQVGPGDEVILSAYDFKANFTNILLLGARPVLVDVDPQSGQMDVERVAEAITPKTRAVLASHLHGSAVEMPRLAELTRDIRIALVEDACQMTLARAHGKPAGTWGDVGILSFGGSKLLTAGRGGALLTNRSKVAQRVKLYTQRGNEAYPLSEMQAAVLLPQLESLPARRQARRAFVEALSKQLAERSGLQPFHCAGTGHELDYYKLGLWYDSAAFEGVSREQFCAAMRAEGIPLDPGFQALHRIHARSRFRAAGELPFTERAGESAVTLHHPFLLEGEKGLGEFEAAVDRLRSHASMLRQVMVKAPPLLTSPAG